MSTKGEPIFNEHRQYQRICWGCGQSVDMDRGVFCRNCRRENLPKREQQVVELISQGFSNKEIAQKTGLSLNTVKVYVSHVYQRLGISGRVNLANWYRDRRESKA